MTFRKAQLSDLDELFTLYQLAISDMQQKGIDQWDELYPNREVIENDVTNDELQILIIDTEIAAGIVVNQSQDIEYSDGKWTGNGPKTAVIHRLCIKPKFQSRGWATKLMNYVEKNLKESGYNDIRLDTFSNNPYALNLYKKLGYTETGEIYFRKGKFILFEKLL